mgnify:CR=1 FL=1
MPFFAPPATPLLLPINFEKKLDAFLASASSLVSAIIIADGSNASGPSFKVVVRVDVVGGGDDVKLLPPQLQPFVVAAVGGGDDLPLIVAYC